VIGEAAFPATFGPGEANETALGSSGTYSGFFARYNPDGTFGYGEVLTETLPSDAVSGAGGTYTMVGSFFGSTTFAAGSPAAVTLTSPYPQGFGVYLATYNSSDLPVWVRMLAAPTTQPGTVDAGQFSIAEHANQYWVSGVWSGQMTFGVGTASATTALASGQWRTFLVRTDAQGTAVTVDTYTSDVSPMRFAKLSGGGLLGQFTFRGAVTLGTGEPNQTSLTSSSTTERDRVDAFFKADGTLDYVIQRPPPLTNELNRFLLPTSDGGFYYTGSFQTLGVLDAGTPQALNLVGTGGTDIVVARYDANRNRLWHRLISGTATSNEFAYHTVPMGDGGLTVVGSYDGACTVSVGESDAEALPPALAGKEDLFVARYDALGSLLFVRRAYGLELDRPHRAAATPDGGLVLAGIHAGPVTFDFCNQSDSTLWVGGEDVFVARYRPGAP
jgi:hypothetical protein